MHYATECHNIFDYFKGCQSYRQMCEQCNTACAHYGKHGSPTWLFRMVESLRTGVSTRPVRRATEATGSIPYNIALSFFVVVYIIRMYLLRKTILEKNPQMPRVQ